MYDSAKDVILKNLNLLQNRSTDEANFVLGNINQFLQILAQNTGRKPDKFTLNNLPKNAILVNSLPKAGTNLVTKILRLIPQLKETAIHFGNSTTSDLNAIEIGETIPVGIDMPKDVSASIINKNLASLKPLDFCSGHLPHSKELIKLVQQNSIKMIVVMRDPRDVVVSHARYVADTEGHPFYDHYDKLSYDERLSASINGAKAGKIKMLNIADRVKSILPWMDQPNVHVIHFEKLVGEKGGGSKKVQTAELKRLITFLEIELTDAQIDALADKVFGGTGTFRKGQIGEWRKELSEKHINKMNTLMNGLWEKSGYKIESLERRSKKRTKAMIYQNQNSKGENLIFLISQPRAGSTLLQRVLGANSKVHTVSEPWIMLHPLYALKKQGVDSEFSSVDAQIGLKDFMANLPNGEDDYYEALRLMGNHLYGQALQNSDKQVFLDKTPRYYFIIKELERLYPQAKFVFLIRNPLSVLSSILKTWVKENWPRLGLHKSDLLQAPQLLLDGIEHLKDKASVVQYEEFVDNPQEVAADLCKQLNIPFENSMLEYGKHKRPDGSMGDSTGIDQYQRPVTDSLHKWIEDLNTAQSKMLAEIYVTLLGKDLFTQMGYAYDEIFKYLQDIPLNENSLSNDRISEVIAPLNLTNQQIAFVEPVIKKYLQYDGQTKSIPVNTTPVSENLQTGLDSNSKENEILVSAIVSTYNSKKFIRGCLESLVDQTLYKQGRLEIIVIDSNSPQNEKAIVEEFVQQNANIRFIRTEQRETVYEAWNRGIKMASGKYVTNANTDDRLKADAIEKLANLLENNPDKVLAYGNSLVTKKENETFESNSSDGTEDLIWPDFDKRTMHSWCYIGPHPVWRKSLHDEFGFFDTKLTSAADWEFWLRTALKNDFIHLDEFIGLYYLSDETVSRRGDTPIIEAGEVRKNYKEKYKNIAGDFILPQNPTITSEDKNTILYVVHNFPPFWYGGTENYVLELVHEMRSKGQDVHVLFPHTDSDQIAPEMRYKSYQGVTTIQMWYDPEMYNQYMDSGGEQVQKMLSAFLKANHYSFVHIQHAQNVPFAIGSILQNLKIPYAVTLHDFTFMCHRNHLFHYRDNKICGGPEKAKCTDCLFHLFERSAEGNQHEIVQNALVDRNSRAKELLAAAKYITAPSTFVKEEFEQNGFIEKNKIKVAPLGLKEIEKVSKKTPKDMLVFGFLGNFTGLKNPDILYEAFKKVTGKTRLKIWGNGLPKELHELNQYCENEQRAKYFGTYTPNELSTILSQVDVVVLPSRIESYSLVVREALMVQTPVIAASVGGILDVVDDGKNGWLFDPADLDQLTQIMQKLVDNPVLVKQAAKVETQITTLAKDADYWLNNYPKDVRVVPTKNIKSEKNNLLGITVLSTEFANRACPYIRVHKPLSLLQQSGKVQYNYVSLDDASNLEAKLADTDILVIQRNVPAQIPFEKLQPILSRFNLKMIYEFDDAFWAIPKGHLAYDYYDKMKPQLEKYLKQADLVSVSTKFIEKHALQHNKNTVIIPNVLDEQLWEAKEPKAHDGVVRILFSGTPTHLQDLGLTLKPLEKILKEYKDKVELVLWGNELVELTKYPNVKRGPEFTSVYEDYARHLQNLEIDFALIPLEETPFNNAKSHIKWLEYSRVGIAGIYSNVNAYKDVVKDKQNGLLTNNTNKAWYRSIKWMIEHPDERINMAWQAAKEVQDNYLLKTNLNKWSEAYYNLADYIAPEIGSANLTEVSIIIPVYNKVEYTQKCIESILGNTFNVDYEIIVVDNASSDGTANYLKTISAQEDRIKVISNNQNAGFAGSNNQAVEHANGEYVLFLNNDTEVLQGWLENMLKVITSDSTVGIVGNKLLYPDGTVQHGGVVIINDKVNNDPLLAQNIFVGQNRSFSDANQMREYQAVTAACLLTSKEHFKQVNGFDEQFWNGYEDVDFCFKIRETGLKVVYQPASEVLHYESKSGTERFAKVAENIGLLHRKWLNKIGVDFIITENGDVRQTSNVHIRPYPTTGNQIESRNEIGGLVSIIMLTCNALDYTKKCVQSIQQNTKYAHEIIFVDNNSKDGSVKYLEDLVKQNTNYKLIKNKDNKGFAAGNNQGVKKAKGEYVFFLNNDVLVAKNWLGDMVSALQKDAAIGMVGPLTNSISGLQRLDNVPYKTDADFEGFAKQIRDGNKGNVTPRRRIAGFAVLMQKEIYQEVEGFDESFGLGNFEDDDLCLKVREAGYAIMVHEGTFIHHFGSQSFKANKIDIGKSLDEKGAVFKENWPDVDYEELLEIKNPLHVIHPKMINEATEYLEANETEKATDIYSKVLDENPLNGEALMGMALAFRLEGHGEQAIPFLKSAFKHYPDNILIPNQLGMVAFEMGDLETAKSHFATAIQMNPSFLEAKRNYGQALIDSGDYENGVVAFTKILEKHPDDVISIVYMAGLYQEIGQTEKATAFINKALEIDPDNQHALDLLNGLEPGENTESFEEEVLLNEKAYQALGSYQIDEAEKLFEQSFDTAENADALFGLALCASQKDLEIKTLTILGNIIEKWPEYAAAYNQLGLLKYQNNEFENARDFFATAIEKDNTLLDAQRNYGLSLIELSDFPNGIAVFNKILEKHPDDVETLVILAGFYCEIEKWSEAENFVSIALTNEPDNTNALELQTLINTHLEAV